jgi:hypothetical protein
MHPMDIDLFEESVLDKAIRLQNGLIASATGGGFDGGDSVYQELRRFFASRADTESKLPDFVRRCRDLGQFWGFVKYERGTYAERRNLLWDAFHPRLFRPLWRPSTRITSMPHGRRPSTGERPIPKAPLPLPEVCWRPSANTFSMMQEPNTRTTLIYRSCWRSLPNSSIWRRTSTRKGYSSRSSETASPW